MSGCVICRPPTSAPGARPWPRGRLVFGKPGQNVPQRSARARGGRLEHQATCHACKPRPRQTQDQEADSHARPGERAFAGGLMPTGRNIYVAVPFLAGTRSSEQLGLLWEDVDFDANVIHSAACKSATAPSPI